MGTYHIIDGSKVRVFYRGNRKTCGRCHKNSDNCPGQSIAKDCEAKGGVRIHLSEHMKNLWNILDFTPTNFELEEEDNTEIQQANGVKNSLSKSSVNIVESFPPLLVTEPSARDIEQCNGIIIRNFPLSISNEELVTFLIDQGLPKNHPQVSVARYKRSMTATIDKINPAVVTKMYSKLHFYDTNQKHFGRQLNCKTLRNMSPMKKDENSVTVIEVGGKAKLIADKSGQQANLDLSLNKNKKSSVEDEFEFFEDTLPYTPVSRGPTIINLNKKRALTPEEELRIMKQRNNPNQN